MVIRARDEGRQERHDIRSVPVLSGAPMAKRRTLVPRVVPERLPPARAHEYVWVNVGLPKGLHAKAQQVAQAYGLSLSAWLGSLAYEHVGYEARLKRGEMARLLAEGRPRRRL